MKDPEGVLERQGPNTQNADAIRFTDLADVGAKAAVICAYLAESMEYAAAGINAPKVIRELELPEEMIEAMDQLRDMPNSVFYYRFIQATAFV